MSIANQQLLRSGFQNFMLVSFAITFSIPALTKQGYLPRLFVLTPEILAAIATLGIFFCLLRGVPLKIRKEYVFLLMLMLISTIFGAFANDVGTGPFISGLRHYLKYLPFFFLPFIFAFTDKDLRQQFRLTFFLCLLQVPMSVYQRFILGADQASGDIVRGTFATGGHQAVFSFSALALVVTFFIRGTISMRTMLIMFTALLAPNLLNETKSSVVFLILVLTLPLIVIPPTKQSMRKIMPILVVSGVFLSVFYVSYQTLFLQENKRFDTTADAFSVDRLETYLTRSNEEKERYGRLAKITLTIDEISKEPATLAFGLGLGNTTESVLGDNFEGQYFTDYELIKGATISYILFDLGFVGLLLCGCLFYLVWRDSRKMARDKDLYGVLAHGWLSVMLIMILAFTYRSAIQSYVLGFYLTYFCGLIAAESGRRAVNRNRPTHQRASSKMDLIQ